MAERESLGIKGVEAIHYYVRDLERSRRFYVDRMDFAELGESDERLTIEGHQRSKAFQAAGCVVICSAPVGAGGRAWRYLEKHPDGIGTLVFQVDDIERTFRLLETRGGTAITDIQRFDGEGGTWLKTFNITTPFGDTTFRFVERRDYALLYPGMKRFAPEAAGTNRFGFSHFDHITSNFQTMMPALLWLEHVMGFQRYWDVEFHTDDVTRGKTDHGSGLRSVVMWDPQSGTKFANNEPYRPYFKNSQINVFHEEHRGDGVQHVALAVRDIVSAVRGLRERGVEFMPTPGSYYDMLPERLENLGIGSIDEDIEELRQLEILVDGAERHRYLLQIFLKDSAGLYGHAEAGPFFYEIIHRKGDEGFGAGNFRALFESIERQHKLEGKAP
jgi:4-hydroxyphenylpyruvate dioxygenase